MQWAVCVQLISNASGVILSECAQLGHGQECHERTFGHKGHQCALVSLDLEYQAHDAYLPIHSWWSAAVKEGVSIPHKVKSMTEGKSRSHDRMRKVRTKVRFSCALLLTTHFLMHAADKGGGAVHTLRMWCQTPLPEATRENSGKWFSLTLQSGTPSCCDTVQVGQNVFVTWQLIATRRLYRTKTMIRHVHFIWSAKNRYNMLDANHDCKNDLCSSTIADEQCFRVRRAVCATSESSPD